MTEIAATQADITRFPSEVIVNAANPSLLGGGGVDGAIHRAAGPRLLEACRELGGARTGEAKMTDAFDIATAEKIVHAVGPVYSAYPPAEAARLLAACYRASLDLAAGHRSIAFPAISTGVYGFPIGEASAVAVAAVRGWLAEHPDTRLETVTLVAHGAADLRAIEQALAD
ncbi:macro domain-containing protein [Conyzicola nivalis]|uniref:macro domain-containing protein n=1 Tax=Conyzicola nivalis TaxID=1477021 RepID=UPI003392B730